MHLRRGVLAIATGRTLATENRTGNLGAMSQLLRERANRRRGERHLTAFVQADTTMDEISPRTKNNTGEITQLLATRQGMPEHAQPHGGHPWSFH